MSLLEVKNLKKIYTTRFGGNQVQALTDVSFSVEEGEFVAIMGESGSGKTTLLNILAALDKPTTGEVILNGSDITSISNADISSFRRDHLGFVFQDFNLLDTFSVEDNILLPLVLSQTKMADMKSKLSEVATSLHLTELLKKYPYEISGGQKQRTAIARALITRPDIILADEPTGSLDSHSATELLNLFEDINNSGQTVLMVTHSNRAASYAKRILFIRDGKVFHQIYKGDMAREELYQKISDTLSILATGGQKNE